MSKLLPLLTIAFLALLMSVPVPGTAEEAPAQSDVQAPTARASSTGLEYVYPPANLSRIENHAALLNDTLQRFNLTLRDGIPNIHEDLVFTFGRRNTETGPDSIVYIYTLNSNGSIGFVYTAPGNFMMLSIAMDNWDKNLTVVGMDIIDKIVPYPMQRTIDDRNGYVIINVGKKYYNANYIEIGRMDITIHNIIIDRDTDIVDTSQAFDNAEEYISTTFPDLKKSDRIRFEVVSDGTACYHYDTSSICQEILFYYRTDNISETLGIVIYYDIHTGKIIFFQTYNASGVGPEPRPHEEELYPHLKTTAYIGIGVTAVIILFFIIVFGSIELKVNGLFANIHRAKIYEIVKAYPGIHFRKIMRNTGLKQGTVAYHLNALEKQGAVQSRQKGEYRCFFTTDMIGEIRLALSSIQHAILYKVKERPGITVSELARDISRNKMVVSYNTTILAGAGLIEKKRVGNATSLFLSGNWERDLRY